MKENTLTYSFENHYSIHRPRTFLRVFLTERSGCYTKGENFGKDGGGGGEGGDSPCKTPSLNFAPLLDITHTKKLSPPVPPLITDQILEKKMSLIAFRQILPTILPAAYTFSSTIMTNLEMFIGNKSLNVKHCPVELSHRITPLNLSGKPWGEGRIPPNSQIFTHFPYQKIP